MSDPELLFEGRRFHVVREFQRDAGGRLHSREIVRHPGAVAILPVLSNQRICLIENYRIAVGQTLIELPAGTLEPGEDPAQTAHRELAEETGYRAQSMELLAEFYMSPGILDERMYLYLATDLDPGPIAHEPGEQIRILLARWPDVISMIREGSIRDAKTLVGLLYYATFRCPA